MISTVLLDAAGEVYAIATTERASEVVRDRRKTGR
jgi:hypothetical protein